MRLESHLESQTGKVDGRAEGQAGGEEGREQQVAAVLGAPEALVRAVPRAVGALDPLWLPDDVIPHDLETELQLRDSSVYKNLIVVSTEISPAGAR